jgi:hypothetical protein
MEELINELKADKGFMALNEIARERVFKAIKNAYAEYEVDSCSIIKEDSLIMVNFHIGEKVVGMAIELEKG